MSAQESPPLLRTSASMLHAGQLPESEKPSENPFEACVPPEDVQGVDERVLNLPLVRNLDVFIAQRDSPFAIQ